MKKKTISVMLVIVVLISSVALSFSAYASSQELVLNQRKTTTMSGYGDLEWYYYTPDQSGLYTFMSLNVGRSIAYLTVRETNEETGMPEIKTLAYAGPFSDPNYQENDHNEFQFALTYHLEKGVTYWYAVGWQLATTTRPQFDVILRLDSYDEEAIESIELSNVPELTAYVDGEARIDGDGRSYFHYDISKIIRNSVITLHYSNGTSSAPTTGKDIVDGYKIKWIDDQNENHWLPAADPDYTHNYIRVEVLNKSATYDVILNIGAMTPISGTVVNLANQPISNAVISIDGSIKAYTNSDGTFRFYCAPGSKKIGISTPTSINYNGNIVVAANADEMQPFSFAICNCDYVRDGYANAKDFSYIRHNFNGAEYEKLKTEYQASINFSKADYN